MQGEHQCCTDHCDAGKMEHALDLATFIVCLHFFLYVSIGSPLNETCMGGNQRREDGPRLGSYWDLTRQAIQRG